MLQVFPIKAFQDNYFWIFHHQGQHDAVVVDPGAAAPVLAWLSQHEMSLAAIVITHHHQDHTGGIDELLTRFPVPVYGPDSVKIPAITHPLREGDSLQVLGARFQVMEVPGHTLDHIAYFLPAGADSEQPLLFCGDTLFAAGCGRIFEGTPAMMYGSLQKLASLPPETAVYCTHEYTLANLAFARAVTPDDSGVADREKHEKEKRRADRPTVPTSIGRELATNPFLRCREPALQNSVQTHVGGRLKEPVEIFAAIRQWKDSF